MKKITKFLVCVMICVCSFALFACGKNKGDSFLPNSSAEIASNGGLIVKNGNFLYFNNGFVNESDQTRNKKDYVSGSLMAVKLGEDGEVALDQDGFMDASQARYISQRLTSYEAGNVFIFGNYVYYTSPCQEQVRGGGWEDARKRVVFYRMHLDKSGKEEKLYQTSSDYDNVEFSYLSEGDQLFLMVKDGDKLLRISANGKNSITVATEIVDVVFQTNGKFVAYILNVDGAYQLKLYNAIANAEVKENANLVPYSYPNAAAPELLYADSENVYIRFSVKEDGDSIDGYILAKAPYSSLACSDLYYDQSKSYSYYFYNGVILANKAGEISRVEDSVLVKIISDTASSIQIAGFVNGMVVYVEGSNIKAVSLTSNNKTEPDITINTEQTILAKYFDVLGNNFYYYATVNNGYYLHYVNLVQVNKPTMLGVYNSEDKPATENARQQA